MKNEIKAYYIGNDAYGYSDELPKDGDYCIGGNIPYLYQYFKSTGYENSKKVICQLSTNKNLIEGVFVIKNISELEKYCNSFIEHQGYVTHTEEYRCGFEECYELIECFLNKQQDKQFSLNNMKKACAVGIDIACKEGENDFQPFEDLINSLQPKIKSFVWEKEGVDVNQFKDQTPFPVMIWQPIHTYTKSFTKNGITKEYQCIKATINY